MSEKIIFLDEVDSTNIYAANLCLNSERIPLAVVADSQTKGSGRMGRAFYSPEKSGIYMTYILDVRKVETLPKFKADHADLYESYKTKEKAGSYRYKEEVLK